MKLNLFVLVSFFLITCTGYNKKGIKYQIVNNSSTEISDITVTTSERVEKSVIEKIEPRKKASGFLSMEENSFDGEYILIFRRSGKDLDTLKTGYYTNGYPLDKNIFFKINSDTVLTEFKSN